MHKILALGTLAKDNMIYDDVITSNLLGGSGFYFSISASVFTQVVLVSVVGTDFPKTGLNILKNNNIDISNVDIKDGKTFSWTGKYYSDKERETISTKKGVYSEYMPGKLNFNKGYRYVFLGSMHPEKQLNFINANKFSKSIIVSDTILGYINSNRLDVIKVVNNSKILLINMCEASLLANAKDINIIIDELLLMGPEYIVIKDGPRGVIIASMKGTKIVPSYQNTKVLDTTGAGDSFAGGFLGYLSTSNDNDLIKAAIYGNAVASICIESKGIDSLINLDLESINSRKNILEKELK